MRFGVCCSNYERVQQAIDAGYDYVELGLAKIAQMSEEEFSLLKEQMAASPIEVESVNQFFLSAAIVGEEADLPSLRAYTEKALARAAQLKVRVAVLGSGKARNISEDYNREKGEAQFVAVLRMCGEIAAKYGITVVIEPLNDRETNLINTVEEGLEFCRRAGHPNVKCLADFYHVICSGETLEAVENAGDLLAHIHLACEGRCMPKDEKDRAMCQEWAAVLKKSGYDGRVSLEGHFDDFETDIATALPILKEFF